MPPLEVGALFKPQADGIVGEGRHTPRPRRAALTPTAQAPPAPSCARTPAATPHPLPCFAPGPHQPLLQLRLTRACADARPELLRLNQLLLCLFLELLSVLVEQPAAYAETLTRVICALQNMQHLVNLMRPEQVRAHARRAARAGRKRGCAAGAQLHKEGSARRSLAWMHDLAAWGPQIVGGTARERMPTAPPSPLPLAGAPHAGAHPAVPHPAEARGAERPQGAGRADTRAAGRHGGAAGGGGRRHGRVGAAGRRCSRGGRGGGGSSSRGRGGGARLHGHDMMAYRVLLSSRERLS